MYQNFSGSYVEQTKKQVNDDRIWNPAKTIHWYGPAISWLDAYFNYMAQKRIWLLAVEHIPELLKQIEPLIPASPE